MNKYEKERRQQQRRDFERLPADFWPSLMRKREPRLSREKRKSISLSISRQHYLKIKFYQKRVNLPA